MASMSAHAQAEAPRREPPELQRIAALLGGKPILRHRLWSPLDVHDLLLSGLPGSALGHLLDGLVSLPRNTVLEKALGMSLRTFQRHNDAPAKPLSHEQSGRIWKFAAILAKATAVFGSREEAERWLDQPAIGLDRRRPIDLLATPAGLEMVETLLDRIRYGVYT